MPYLKSIWLRDSRHEWHTGNSYIEKKNVCSLQAALKDIEIVRSLKSQAQRSIQQPAYSFQASQTSHMTKRQKAQCVKNKLGSSVKGLRKQIPMKSKWRALWKTMNYIYICIYDYSQRRLISQKVQFMYIVKKTRL